MLNHKYGRRCLTVVSAIAFAVLIYGSAGEYGSPVRVESPGRGKTDGSLVVKAILSGVIQKDMGPGFSDSDDFGELAKVGQKVTAGQALAVVESGLGRAVTARAPADGTISKVLIKPETRVSSGDVLFRIEVSR